MEHQRPCYGLPWPLQNNSIYPQCWLVSVFFLLRFVYMRLTCNRLSVNRKLLSMSWVDYILCQYINIEQQLRRTCVRNGVAYCQRGKPTGRLYCSHINHVYIVIGGVLLGGIYREQNISTLSQFWSQLCLFLGRDALVRARFTTAAVLPFTCLMELYVEDTVDEYVPPTRNLNGPVEQCETRRYGCSIRLETHYNLDIHYLSLLPL